MHTSQVAAVTENRYIKSLRSQIGSRSATATNTELAIVSANPNLDTTAVSRLCSAGVLVLRTESEALSKTLDAGLLADAIAWAATEADVISLTLVGHSMAATIPLDNLVGSPGLLERMQIHSERVNASKLKLKDDFARFVVHPQVEPLLADGVLAIHALFYLQESGGFMKYDFENDDFVPLG
ncbi:MAG: hypothetical protein HQ518_04280 [Rhodopirellula sp.]|nr:hypothetical protein [Rhodopirellula sp.]